MLTESDFFASSQTALPDEGRYSWSAPSNIAIVKYWGKKDNQIPANPSASITLNRCKTVTNVSFKKSSSPGFDLYFDGEKKDAFRPKISKFLERIAPYCPYLDRLHLTIETSNTFPHSSGIASSASGMAALAVNVMSIERLLNPEMTDEYFNRKASFLARLGSGSACRSIDGKIVVWGNHRDVESSDFYGVPFEKIHREFEGYKDTILLVDKGEKKVSSSAGHDLMHNHPFAQQRFDQAHENLSDLLRIFETGDLDGFVKLAESEALTLHSMMMTSTPYFILMRPNTLEIINRIWNFRADTNIPVCFTLDAGANVHLLYPAQFESEVNELIKSDLSRFCQNDHYICDEMGTGAVQLTQSENIG